MLSLYNNYFAKDKPLRHYTQHLLVAFIGFITLPLFGINLNLQTLFYFIFATFVVDLDGLLSVFIFRNKISEAGKIVESLKSLRFMESATLGTIHHKKLNRLILHNVFGLLFVVIILFYAYTSDNLVLIVTFWAILSHFVFDIWDDYYQLGHINNWFWPVKLLKN